MTPEEAFKVCRIAKALSPAQAVDEYTPDAWALVLRPWRFVDAEQALTELGGEQEWIHVSHVVARIKRIRSKRVADFGVLPDPPPGHDPDDTEAHQQYLAAITRRIADGDITPQPQAAALGPRRNALALGQIGRHVDEARAALNHQEEA